MKVWKRNGDSKTIQIFSISGTDWNISRMLHYITILYLIKNILLYKYVLFFLFLEIWTNNILMYISFYILKYLHNSYHEEMNNVSRLDVMYWFGDHMSCSETNSGKSHHMLFHYGLCGHHLHWSHVCTCYVTVYRKAM